MTARAASARATATVDCGALGSVTVEALPLRELERFSFDSDGDRGLFYAACRELQQTGNALFEAGKLARPDGVTAFLSDSEAELAADAVRRLSGWTAVTQADDASELSGSAPDQEAEVQLSSVQENPSEQDTEGNVRPESAAENERDLSEVRRNIVQENMSETGGGRVPREFSEKDSENPPYSEILDKTQKILPVNSFRAQDMGDRAEETLRQSESDFGRKGKNSLHETESDFSKSPQGIELDFPKGLHKSESEYAEKSRLSLHETESESAERIARQLLEGLRQASWVR